MATSSRRSWKNARLARSMSPTSSLVRSMRVSGCATGGPVSPNERGSTCLSASAGSPRSLGQRPWRSPGSSALAWWRSRTRFAWLLLLVGMGLLARRRRWPQRVPGSDRPRPCRGRPSACSRVGTIIAVVGFLGTALGRDGFWDLGSLGFLTGAVRNAAVRDRDLSDRCLCRAARRSCSPPGRSSRSSG